MNKPLRITFLSPKRYSFYPEDYTERGLGGSESALVLLSKELARRGHDVEVFNCCYKEGVYDGVPWRNIWEYSPATERDVVISLRLLESFNHNINAPLRAVWIHDSSLPGAGKLDADGRVNLWIAVSETEKSFVEQGEEISQENWFITRNGIDGDVYNEQIRKTKKVPGRAIYCSAPDRGLTYLLSYWPKIRERVPHAELIVTGSFALWGNADEENDRFFSDIYSRADEFKITFLKRIPKEELAVLQASSCAMLYPTKFDEMYCISAIECMSVGTPVVSNARAAMIERIDNGIDGYLLNGGPDTEGFEEQFIDRAVDLLSNEQRRLELGRAAIGRTSHLSYRALARKWEEKFNQLLTVEEWTDATTESLNQGKSNCPE